MAQKSAKFEAEWDEEFEKKLEEKAKNWSKNCDNKKYGSAAGGGAVYGLGLIGALVYYLPQANSFWTVIMGILKSIVWPAMLIYQLMSFLKM